MKAARLYAAGDLRVEDVPDPGEPGPDEVRLRVEMAGICGSDLHNFHTGQWISRAPSTPGHEFVARVESLGDDVNGLTVGDRVVADSRVPCGICDACTSGRAYLCAEMAFVGEANDGGFAPVTVQKAHQVERLPDQSVPATVAALAEPLAVALHAVNRAQAHAESDVLVIGAGPIGALCALALRHRGVERVRIADRNQARRDFVLDVTGARPAELDALTDPPDRVIDTTGAAAVLPDVLASMRRGGRVAVVGLYGRPMSLDANLIVEGGLDVAGCAAFDGELADAVSLLPSLSGQLARLASTPHSLANIPQLYDQLSNGEGSLIKALVDPAMT